MQQHPPPLLAFSSSTAAIFFTLSLSLSLSLVTLCYDLRNPPMPFTGRSSFVLVVLLWVEKRKNRRCVEVVASAGRFSIKSFLDVAKSGVRVHSGQ